MADELTQQVQRLTNEALDLETRLVEAERPVRAPFEVTRVALAAEVSELEQQLAALKADQVEVQTEAAALRRVRLRAGFGRAVSSLALVVVVVAGQGVGLLVPGLIASFILYYGLLAFGRRR